MFFNREFDIKWCKLFFLLRYIWPVTFVQARVKARTHSESILRPYSWACVPELRYKGTRYRYSTASFPGNRQQYNRIS